MHYALDRSCTFPLQLVVTAAPYLVWCSLMARPSLVPGRTRVCTM